jgi:hypothetical protein
VGIVGYIIGLLFFIAAHGHSVIIFWDPIRSTDSTIRKSSASIGPLFSQYANRAFHPKQRLI